jgi:hypothetical protein
MAGTSKRPKTMGVNHSDYFATPPSALAPLMPYLYHRLADKQPRRIWECCAGKDPLGESLRTDTAYGPFEVTSTDILGADQVGPNVHPNVDYLKHDIGGFYIAVTNPPYSKKNECLARAYELERPFAFLLPYTGLEAVARQDLFIRYGIELLILRKRVKFITPSGKEGGAHFPVAWFTWGLNLGSALVFEGGEP